METRSLSLEDLETVRTALRAWTAKERPGPKASTDMADIIDLDAARPNLTINGTIKTEPGKGTYRKSSPKPRSTDELRV